MFFKVNLISRGVNFNDAFMHILTTALSISIVFSLDMLLPKIFGSNLRLYKVEEDLFEKRIDSYLNKG